jgi:hypothetical protein
MYNCLNLCKVHPNLLVPGLMWIISSFRRTMITTEENLEETAEFNFKFFFKIFVKTLLRFLHIYATEKKRQNFNILNEGVFVSALHQEKI